MAAFTPSSLIGCPWMEWGYQAMGERAIAGARHNPTVQDFLLYCGLNTGDETAWCSAFVNWCMEQTGIRGTRRANARSWLDWGDDQKRYTPLDTPAFGCVTVLWRGNPDSWQGHVGFCVGRQGNRVLLLGGNQTGSAVTIQPYGVNCVLGYHWATRLSGYVYRLKAMVKHKNIDPLSDIGLRKGRQKWMEPSLFEDCMKP